MWQRATSSSTLNPRAALNLPPSISPRALRPLLPLHPARCLFNYYSPRSLRHFQGVLTITDETGDPRAPRAVADGREKSRRRRCLHLDINTHTYTPRQHCFPPSSCTAATTVDVAAVVFPPPIFSVRLALECNSNVLRSRTKFNSRRYPLYRVPPRFMTTHVWVRDKGATSPQIEISREVNNSQFVGFQCPSTRFRIVSFEYFSFLQYTR